VDEFKPLAGGTRFIQLGKESAESAKPPPVLVLHSRAGHILGRSTSTRAEPLYRKKHADLRRCPGSIDNCPPTNLPVNVYSRQAPLPQETPVLEEISPDLGISVDRQIGLSLPRHELVTPLNRLI
jgi:hypothetical protein